MLWQCQLPSHRQFPSGIHDKLLLSNLGPFHVIFVCFPTLFISPSEQIPAALSNIEYHSISDLHLLVLKERRNSTSCNPRAPACTAPGHVIILFFFISIIYSIVKTALKVWVIINSGLWFAKMFFACLETCTSFTSAFK